MSETEVSIALMLNLLHSSANQELFEKHLCNQGIRYERFPLCIGSHHVQPQNQHFPLSAKMNGTQRKILVRMHVVCQKAPLGLMKKPIGLVVIDLC